MKLPANFELHTFISYEKQPMINKAKKVAGIALSTSISGIFAVGFATEAKAFDFTVNLGSHSLNGGESVTLPPQTIGATGTLTDISASLDYNEPTSNGNFASDLLIQIDDGNGNSIDIGGALTTSDVKWEQEDDTDASGSYVLTTPAFTSGLTSDGTSDWTFSIQNDFADSAEYNNLALDLELSPATAVPFGVSTDLSILVLGSLYGASRLRKKLASK